MLSKFFINRPIFAAVISIIIILAGLIAIKELPVQEYPSVVPPQIMVQAVYPGADAQTLSKTVAAPLEEAINGVKNMIYMTSTASPNGMLMLSVTFKIGTDPATARVDVNNRVQLALNKLPEAVRRQGISVRERSPDILKVFAFTSKNGKHNIVYISNYMLVNVLDDLKRVPGVGEAMLFGSKNYSIRVWLKSDKLASYGLSPTDIISAIRSQNEQFAAGQIGQEPIKSKQTYTYTVTTKGRLKTVKQFENIIIRSNSDGSALKLKDVARLELGAERYYFKSTYNNKPSTIIGVFLTPGANALQVSKAVDNTMKELSSRFPADLEYHNVYDTTKFIQESIKEVIYTLILSIILVILVIYIFLGTIRATIIPVLAIPVSIIGTFAGFYAAGFSINLLTLFGLILAIGLVVDDAIIVIENVDRILNTNTENLSVKDATIKAMGEITGPIIAIVLLLSAVFIPASFVGGFSGKMYQQFAITIAISVVISGIVALTLTPAMCAIFLKKERRKPFWLTRKFNILFYHITKSFTKGVRYTIRYGAFAIALFAVMLFATNSIIHKLPTGLVPDEDKGNIMIFDYLMPGASLSRTAKVQKDVSKILMNNPNIATVGSLAGIDMVTFAYKTDSGVGFAHLKDWSKRKESSQEIVGKLMGQFSQYKEAYVMALNPPPIIGMSTTGGFEMYVQDRTGSDIHLLDKYVKEIVGKANQRPELRMVRSTLDTNVPQYRIVVNREKAKSLGVPIANVFTTLQTTFGTAYANDFNLYGRTYHVNIQSEGNFRENLKGYNNVFVRSTSGNLIPVSLLVTLKRIVGPGVVQRFNAFQAAKITGQQRFGYSSGDAMRAIEEVAKSVLPAGYIIAWSGTSYQEKKLSKAGNKSFIYALVFVFLILAALYESWSIPFAIILSVPFALFGAALAVWLRGLESDIYFQVGIITLVGLSAKNAILMVQFALQRLKEGYPLLDATIEGARIRFRPIIMTSFAFIAATIPLAISTGAGANNRHIIGTTVVGGMLMATLIGIFFIPLFFYLIMKLKEKFIQRRKR
ncbi:MAG: multidrug efflux RND transporter permease subunit [Campylobacterota bacterium]|nr:multidrug efflux RND transporter permease subunit [Campylobacterota bacterium]